MQGVRPGDPVGGEQVSNFQAFHPQEEIPISFHGASLVPKRECLFRRVSRFSARGRQISLWPDQPERWKEFTLPGLTKTDRANRQLFSHPRLRGGPSFRGNPPHT